MLTAAKKKGYSKFISVANRVDYSKYSLLKVTETQAENIILTGIDIQLHIDTFLE